MKRKIKNGMSIFIILISLFATIPSGVMAEDMASEDENVLLGAITTTQTETEVNVSFTPNCLADFKVNDLTAKRSGNDVIFALNYESTRAGGYSFFNPPNGSSIMKYDFSGIKTGKNTLELKLTLDEFKKSLTNENITMKFWVNSDASASWIYFNTDQLSSLASQDGIDNPPVEILPTAITLDKTSINLTIDTSEKITPSLSPSNTTKTTVTWSSNSSDIATVDSNGNIKGIKEGTAIITATTVNKLSAKCSVTIKPSEEMNDDFTYSLIEGGISITGYTSNSSDIEIPKTIENKTVLTIADWAFSDFTSLNSVSIPNTVKNIGDGSFSGCTNLTTIVLPETLTHIGSGAFRLCENLTTIDLLDDISYLGEGAFYSCKSLASINLPSNITTLYANTFKDCTNLKAITIPAGVKLVGNASFFGCNSLETIQFNSTTTKIVDFENVIPSSATIIGYNPSTAKTYAQKYNRKFKELGNQNSGDSSISYQTHVQDVGWQDLKYNGSMSGTSGRSLRLEGIKIQLNNYENLGVSYQTHIQNIGWEANTNRGWKSDGAMSGTQGLSYRLEAIQIKLTGSNAENYDIYYQVHAQNVGWMGWAKNGESAGTAGYGYRLEGISIKILPKGSSAPGSTANAYMEYVEPAYKQAYKNLVSQAYQQYISTSKYACHYSIFDMDSNGTPELLLSKGTSEADNTFFIYTFENNRAQYVGKFHSGHTGLYGMSSSTSGQLLAAYAHMLGQQVYELYLNNGTISSTKIQSGTVNSVEEYFKTAYPIPWKYAFDLSLIN
jgi:uncharacterized protein YjdB